jgi:hypothetical protein
VTINGQAVQDVRIDDKTGLAKPGTRVMGDSGSIALQCSAELATSNFEKAKFKNCGPRRDDASWCVT